MTEDRDAALEALAAAVRCLALRDGYTRGTMGFILIEVERSSWLALKRAHDALQALGEREREG